MKITVTMDSQGFSRLILEPESADEKHLLKWFRVDKQLITKMEVEMESQAVSKVVLAFYEP